MPRPKRGAFLFLIFILTFGGERRCRPAREGRNEFVLVAIWFRHNTKPVRGWEMVYDRNLYCMAVSSFCSKCCRFKRVACSYPFPTYDARFFKFINKHQRTDGLNVLMCRHVSIYKLPQSMHIGGKFGGKTTPCIA